MIPRRSAGTKSGAHGIEYRRMGRSGQNYKQMMERGSHARQSVQPENG
jgi:hypothetical protein